MSARDGARGDARGAGAGGLEQKEELERDGWLGHGGLHAAADLLSLQAYAGPRHRHPSSRIPHRTLRRPRPHLQLPLVRTLSSRLHAAANVSAAHPWSSSGRSPSTSRRSRSFLSCSCSSGPERRRRSRRTTCLRWERIARCMCPIGCTGELGAFADWVRTGGMRADA